MVSTIPLNAFSLINAHSYATVNISVTGSVVNQRALSKEIIRYFKISLDFFSQVNYNMQSDCCNPYGTIAKG